MKHPQTAAENFYSEVTPERLETISKYGCCAFVLLWCLGIKPDDMEAVKIVNSMMKAKVIDADCTVRWAEAVKFLTGREITVEFKDIRDILSIRDRTPVRYDYKGKGHWIGAERGMIAFNPLEYSQCVDKGRPVTARIIRLK